MDLHMKQKLDTVTVFDLMNNSFYIPDYQRGYRWTRLEVEKLLGDLEDFYNVNTDGSTFCCMQPLVVFFNKEQDAWEVIDGQQRLTTMYLILNQQKGLLEQIYPDKGEICNGTKRVLHFRRLLRRNQNFWTAYQQKRYC